MALNLSTLTSPATSGDVLAEALTTADFLEGVPVLRNLSRGSNKGGDAKQDVALNQPKALPLIDGEGYLYVSGIAGNRATVPASSALNPTGNLELEAYVVGYQVGYAQTIMGKYESSSWEYLWQIDSNNELKFWRPQADSSGHVTSGVAISPNQKGVKVTHNATSGLTQFFQKLNGTWVQLGTDKNIAPRAAAHTFTAPVRIGAWNTNSLNPMLGAIKRVIVRDGIGGTPVLDVDFTATNIRHGDIKFKCATGQVVTINQSGLDPSTIIKKPVLRFDGVNDGLRGVFANNINSGYMFAAFSVLGDGGEAYGRVFSTNLSTSGNDFSAAGTAFSIRYSDTLNLSSLADATINQEVGMFDDANGDILHVVKIKSGEQTSSVNNAALLTSNRTTSTNSDEFNIGFENNTGSSVCIDLEFLGFFPETLTTDQAADVVNYINNRNNVFSLIDSQGFYFYNSQNAPVGAISSGSASWNGRIVGSDNGDTDKLATQATANDQPVSDGYVVTFADNSDHLDIPSTTQAGWQIVGSSLGTFAYRVNANAVTELNLLGNKGVIRTTGDLYGIILLPESATGKDIEDARKLLIDRGAADGTSSSSAANDWYGRNDIVEFKHLNTSSLTDLRSSFRDCLNLSVFPALDLSNVDDFSSAWRNTSALTSFPAGAKLGTSASNVNFTEAWRESGVTSFNTDLPTGTVFQKTWRQSALSSFGAIDLSAGTSFNSSWQLAASLVSFGAIDARNGTTFQEAWRDCTALTSFPAGAKLGTEAANVNFSSAWQSSGLTSLPPLDLSKGVNFLSAFLSSNISSIDPNVLLGTAANSAIVDFTNIFNDCQNLTEVPVGLDLSKGDKFQQSFRNCASLVDFAPNIFDSIGTPLSSCFNNTWQGTVSLNASSVGNILVSIDTSGQSAPSAEPEIKIDYNVSTGSLSAATNSAIDSLSGKGWQVYINGVLTIPNVLSLQPAAAYSLRSFNSDLDPNVVNVRRSSDNATSNFKASEVSDGTLVAFVGAGNDGHVTTWYDQSSNTRNSTQIFASEQPKIVESGTLVSEGGLAGINFHTETSYLFLNHDVIHGQATLDSYYVTKATGNRYIYPSLATNSGTFGMVAHQGGGDVQLSLNYGSPNYYANGSQITGTTRGDIHTATSGGQKLVVHQGANTTNSAWGVSNMNFGNYVNSSDWGFTGKLQEMIFFNTDQSANRTGIEKNINDTYTIY